MIFLLDHDMAWNLVSKVYLGVHQNSQLHFVVANPWLNHLGKVFFPMENVCDF